MVRKAFRMTVNEEIIKTTKMITTPTSWDILHYRIHSLPLILRRHNNNNNGDNKKLLAHSVT